MCSQLSSTSSNWQRNRQTLRDGRYHHGRIAYRREFYDPSAMQISRSEIACDRSGQAGLANATGTAERDQPSAIARSDERGSVVSTAIQRRQCGDQIARYFRAPRRRCCHRCGCACPFTHHSLCRKAIATSGNRSDGLGAQQLAQAGHLDSEVVVFDHQARPCRRDQFIFAHHAIAALHQCQQHVERARAHGHGSPVHPQLSLVSAKLETPEEEGFHAVPHHLSLRHHQLGEGTEIRI
jgi:hypothetical protein